jgi:hypothetical protein
MRTLVSLVTGSEARTLPPVGSRGIRAARGVRRADEHRKRATIRHRLYQAASAEPKPLFEVNRSPVVRTSDLGKRSSGHTALALAEAFVVPAIASPSTQRATGRFLSIMGPAGVIVTIADWMLDPVVCAAMLRGTPHVNLAALVELERLLMCAAGATLLGRFRNRSGGSP